MSSRFSPEYGQSDTDTVSLVDEAGRSLNCYIEHTAEADDTLYMLLLPIDSPVVVIAWDDDEESSEATWIEDEVELDEIFGDAKAVLSEQNLTLKRTAFTLTVAGELPEVDEEDVLTLEMAEDDDSPIETEELQLLASFYHNDQEYSVYTPLDPLLFFARQTDSGKIELISPEELQEVRPLLEDLLFNELE
ncbi:MAG: DUF3727 domain-containing protein [Chroococcales cyanobacterium]